MKSAGSFPICILICSLGLWTHALAQDEGAKATPESPKPSEAVAKPEEKKVTDPEMERLKKELERLQVERDTLQAQNSIAEAKLAQDLAERKAKLERDKLALEEATAKLNEAKTVAELKAQLEIAQLEAQISKAKMDAQTYDLRAIEDDLRAEISKLRIEVEEKEQKKERQTYADQEPVYLEDPYQDGCLVLSDRRIPLNNVITLDTADYVSDRINYYNNKSTEYPIFLVIDDSPGGSVMAGYKILKAMESSEAPVHAVVKSYAASMAAVITTLSDRSYAYPNAILLQHQISGLFLGNLTQQREDLEETQEWWRRLAGPVAEKMGVSLDEFIEQMYANESTGDWDEFADSAQKLKWVDVIVEEIRETGVVRSPDVVESESASALKPSPARFGLNYTENEKGRPICILPRINAHDRWWLDNRDGFYQAP